MGGFSTPENLRFCDGSWAPAKTLILEQASPHNSAIIAGNYPHLHILFKVFAGAQLCKYAARLQKSLSFRQNRGPMAMSTDQPSLCANQLQRGEASTFPKRICRGFFFKSILSIATGLKTETRGPLGGYAGNFLRTTRVFSLGQHRKLAFENVS